MKRKVMTSREIEGNFSLPRALKSIENSAGRGAEFD